MSSVFDRLDQAQAQPPAQASSSTAAAAAAAQPPPPQHAPPGEAAAAQAAVQASAAYVSTRPVPEESEVLGKRRLQKLLHEVAPNEQLSPEVEDLLLELVDDFIESTTTFAAKLAAHRGSNVLDASDVKLHLEKNWQIHVPGFGPDLSRNLQRAPTDAHEQRLKAVRSTINRMANRR